MVGYKMSEIVVQSPTTTKTPAFFSLRRHWLRRLLVFTGVIFLLWCFRSPILTTLAGQLVADDSPNQGTTHLVLGGDRAFEIAALHVSRGETKQILVVHWLPDRLEKLGLVPSSLDVASQQLASRNVPKASVACLPGEPGDAWEIADGVRLWLLDHPAEQLVVYCPRFDSRRLRSIIRNALGDNSTRVHIWALPHREYDESNWWTSKKGLMDVWQSSIGLLHYWIAGRPNIERATWDPDAYEKSLN
jgi:hypothetical protein